jgi:hypothetical protein
MPEEQFDDFESSVNELVKTHIKIISKNPNIADYSLINAWARTYIAQLLTSVLPAEYKKDTKTETIELSIMLSLLCWEIVWLQAFYKNTQDKDVLDMIQKLTSAMKDAANKILESSKTMEGQDRVSLSNIIIPKDVIEGFGDKLKYIS